MLELGREQSWNWTLEAGGWKCLNLTISYNAHWPIDMNQDTMIVDTGVWNLESGSDGCRMADGPHAVNRV